MSTSYSRRPRYIAYLGWIKTLPCAICGRTGSEYFAVEAAHSGPRGLSQKTSDRNAIPLCVEHHRAGRNAQHQLQKNFEARFGLDIAQLIVRLNRAWELMCSARGTQPW